MSDAYVYTMELKLKAGVTQDQAILLLDALYDAAYGRRSESFLLIYEKPNWIVSLDSAEFNGNDFELTLYKNGFLAMLEDQEYGCEGFAQKYFYRIRDGILEYCGTVQVPDGKWQDYRSLFKLVDAKESEAHV